MPISTLILALTTIGAFFLELAAGGRPACDAWGLVPATLEPYQLVSSLFLHNPDDYRHIAFNMTLLVVFGCFVETAIGSARFLALYLTAGALGGLFHALVMPGSDQVLVGASGAVFGVLAVAGGLRPRLLGFVATLAGLNIWYAVAGTGGNVSFATHLGGLAVGALFFGAMKVAGDEAVVA